jgi:hypothetical protein
MYMYSICHVYTKRFIVVYVMDMHGIYLLYPRLACIYMVYTWYIPCISKAYGNVIHMCGIYQLKYKWVCSVPFFILIYLWYTMNIQWINMIYHRYINIKKVRNKPINILVGIYHTYGLHYHMPLIYMVYTMYIPCIYMYIPSVYMLI